MSQKNPRGQVRTAEIRYETREGSLWYTYRVEEDLPTQHHSRVTRFYEASGSVPEEVVQQGLSAVRQYAEENVEEQVAQQREKNARHDAYCANPDFPVEVVFESILLMGRIISAKDTTLTVQLEEPYTGTEYVIFNWVSAMAGHFIFDKEGNFTPHAIRSAQELLIRVYKKEKYNADHRDLIDLTDQLNTPE